MTCKGYKAMRHAQKNVWTEIEFSFRNITLKCVQQNMQPKGRPNRIHLNIKANTCEIGSTELRIEWAVVSGGGGGVCNVSVSCEHVAK